VCTGIHYTEQYQIRISGSLLYLEPGPDALQQSSAREGMQLMDFELPVHMPNVAFNPPFMGRLRQDSTDIKAEQLAFPWLLTTLHTSCAFLGCYILLRRGHFKITRLTTSENLLMIAFSFLFTINIAISNVSL